MHPMQLNIFTQTNAQLHTAAACGNTFETDLVHAYDDYTSDRHETRSHSHPQPPRSKRLGMI